jgi:hypothetical protein
MTVLHSSPTLIAAWLLNKFCTFQRTWRVHYHVHRCPAVIPTLKQMNPVHTFPSYFHIFNFKIIFLSMPGSLSMKVSSLLIFWVKYYTCFCGPFNECYVGTSNMSDIWPISVAKQKLVDHISEVTHKRNNKGTVESGVYFRSALRHMIAHWGM